MCSRERYEVNDAYEIKYFFRLLYAIASNCVHNCEDHSSFDFISAVHIYDLFHMHHSYMIILASKPQLQELQNFDICIEGRGYGLSDQKINCTRKLIPRLSETMVSDDRHN